MTKFLNILILALVLTLSAQAKKVNLFTSGNGGDAPYDIALSLLDDIGKSEIISINWGDNTVDNGFDVTTHSYLLPGSYTIIVTYDEVIGDDNENKIEVTEPGKTDEFQIIVSEFMEVSISTLSNLACNPGMCIEMNSELDISLDVSNYSYEWSINGNVDDQLVGAQPTICFDTPGEYAVTLTVTGYQDEVTTESVIVTVWDYFAVDFTSDQTSSTFNMLYDKDNDEWTGGDITFTDASAGNNIQDNNSWGVDGSEAQAGGDSYVFTIDNLPNDESTGDDYTMDYVISLDASNDCLDSDGNANAGNKTMTVTVNAALALGIADYTEGLEVRTIGNVFEYSARGQRIESIEVVSIMGVTVSTTSTNLLDLTNAAKGLYFVKVTTNQQVFTTKVMID
jgi:hypothetical protein